MTFLIFLIACATIPKMPGSTRPVGREAYVRQATTTAVGIDAALGANYYLRHRPKGFRDDCSGFVSASYDRAGIPMNGTVASLWGIAKKNRYTHKRKRPRIGDLAFFDNTHDRNKDGKLNDDLTHIGIVLSVDDDGTITLAHSGTSKGRTTMKMNLYHPATQKTESGRVLNSYLRRKTKKDRRNTKYLSGQLFLSFATVKREDAPNWAAN
jgi:hypothetical protein